MGTSRVTFTRSCWLLLAAVAAAPRPTAAAEGCVAGGREAYLWVTVEDGGRAIEGAVELNEARAGATGAVLAVPACPRHLHVTAGQYAWEQEVMLKEGTLTAVRLQASVTVAPVRRQVAVAEPRAAPPSGGMAPGGERSGAAVAAAAVAPPAAPAAPATPATRLTSGAEDRLPAGMAAVHYRRPDRKYAGWTLHAWEENQNGPSISLPGTSWKNSLKPAGTDDFGAYWLIPMDAFPDGKVNFVVHRGEEREHCGDRDSMTFKDLREAWVVSGQCFHFDRKQEALKAAKK